MSSLPDPPDSGPIFSEFASDPDMTGLVELFVGDLPDRISTLMDAWTTEEFETVQRIAHQLKGASAGYGFTVIGTTAGNLEAGLKSVGEQASTSTTLHLKREFDQLIELCQRATAT